MKTFKSSLQVVETFDKNGMFGDRTLRALRGVHTAYAYTEVIVEVWREILRSTTIASFSTIDTRICHRYTNVLQCVRKITHYNAHVNGTSPCVSRRGINSPET